MVHDKQNTLLQRLDKAAKILDLLGDIPHALQVLQANLEDPEIYAQKPILLETLVFLADICSHLGKSKDARKYITQARNLDLSGVDSGRIEASLGKLRRIEQAID